MKKFLDSMSDRARRLVKRLTLGAAVAIAIVLTAPAAHAQIGTYVATRPVVLQVGTLTNVQTASTVVFTNFLNYSGFHRPGLWLTVVNTNAAGSYSNIVVNVYPTPGSGNGYLNTLLGTNQVWATSPAFTWATVVAANSTNVVFTNLDWTVADSVAAFQVVVSTTSTNKLPFAYQVDGVITP